MRTTIITEKQRGLQYKNGKFVKLLTSGKHRSFGNTKIDVVELDAEIKTARSPLSVLMQNEVFASAVTFLSVADCQLALHFKDGKFENAFSSGEYAFWNDGGVHTFLMADLSVPEISSEIPDYVFSRIHPSLYIRVEIAEYQKGRLYYDGRLVKLLDAGVYYFWRTEHKVEVEWVDTRRRQYSMLGQEMLTQDKVTLRINVVCTYRISDYIKIGTEIEDYEAQLHVALQLALRDCVGKLKLDEVLMQKDMISQAVYSSLSEAGKGLYLSVLSADIRDIILPGEIREIMNTVLIAEKKAQANVITRREEVASTRSLLNTAKLMEENPTLYKLKELEYVERICEHVGSIHVSGSGDLLSELSSILHGKKEA